MSKTNEKKAVVKKVKSGDKSLKGKNKVGTDTSVENGGETAIPSVQINDHPYLSYIQKRIRSYRKKSDKIKMLEIASAEGKILNEQQTELVSTKSMLIKLLCELEAVRQQFIESHQKELQAQEKIVETPVSSPAIEDVRSEIKEQADATNISEIEYRCAKDLLQVLHAVNLYKTLNQDVPAVLNFYSKVLRGKTRPFAETSYEENLAESLEVAQKYMQRSDKIFACETTYAELREIVERLVTFEKPVNTKIQVNTDLPGITDRNTGEESQLNSSDESHAKSMTNSMAILEGESVANINFFTESTLICSPTAESTQNGKLHEPAELPTAADTPTQDSTPRGQRSHSTSRRNHEWKQATHSNGQSVESENNSSNRQYHRNLRANDEAKKSNHSQYRVVQNKHRRNEPRASRKNSPLEKVA